MAVSCYLCDEGISAKPGGHVNNTPHGVCGICGVMACPGHSSRDSNEPRFQCVICIPIVAAVSASVQFSGLAPSPLASRLTALLTRIGGEASLVRSVKEFLGRYPEFEAWLDRLPQMQQRARRGFRALDVEPFYSSLDEQARDLLLLAIIIVLGCEIPTKLLPEALRQLVESLQ